MLKSKKSPSKRMSILIMPPKGGAHSFSVSPILMAVGLVFLAVFMFVSIVVMNLYFALFLDHHDLEREHQTTVRELYRLQHLYSYQAMVSRDYSSYVGEDSAQRDDGFIPLASLPLADGAGAADLLDAWADFFSDPARPGLEMAEFRVGAGGFNFLLRNLSPERPAEGRLLLLFAVLYPGDNRLTLLSRPDFDPRDREPDFSRGLAYNILSSKPFAGGLNLPEGTRVAGMVAVARSNDGKIVLKKKLVPGP